MILPVPLGELPVRVPELTEDIHEKVLPGMAEEGVKFNVWFEQSTCVLLVPTLSGYIRNTMESILVELPQLPFMFSEDEPLRYILIVPFALSARLGV